MTPVADREALNAKRSMIRPKAQFGIRVDPAVKAHLDAQAAARREARRVAELQQLLGEWTLVTLTAAASSLHIDEAGLVKLCRRHRIPTFTRAGSLWLGGRRPRSHSGGGKE